ncbi:MAG TPA: DNA polymerase III subunit beta, partial [Gammaproteobacteria bacterium]|nr:DNA polymerase III subunit beta [Gammaproteobacteria bacterium]
MQFEIEREALLKPLQSVIGVVERRQTLPALANVLAIADEEGLSLTTTDLEVELQARIGVAVGETGQITIPARKLMDIVRNLPEESRIRVTVDQDRVVVRSGR